MLRDNARILCLATENGEKIGVCANTLGGIESFLPFGVLSLFVGVIVVASPAPGPKQYVREGGQPTAPDTPSSASCETDDCLAPTRDLPRCSEMPGAIPNCLPMSEAVQEHETSSVCIAVDGAKFLTEELQKPENAAWVSVKANNVIRPLYDEGYLTVEEFISLSIAQVELRMGRYYVGKPLSAEAFQNLLE